MCLGYWQGMIHMKVPGLLGLSLERLGGVHKWKVGEEEMSEIERTQGSKVQRSRVNGQFGLSSRIQ